MQNLSELQNVNGSVIVEVELVENLQDFFS